jgi:hypothetical protein
VTKGLFSAVMAPTHFISGPSDAWFARDLELSSYLRQELESAGGSRILIYYRLATLTSALRDPAKFGALLTGMRSLDIDAVWLRLHPFGTSSSGPLALRGYMAAARQLHALDVPVVGEHTGTIGVAMAAYGATGGVESGVTTGERVDLLALTRASARDNNPFAPSPRVYLSRLGAFMSRERAAKFLANRSMRSAFGCSDPACCPRGLVDLLADPKRHFLSQRSKEIERLADAPSSQRAQLYLNDFLRPASDLAVRASQFDNSLLSVRQRLESWRVTLSSMQTDVLTSPSRPALGTRHKRRPAERNAQVRPS